MTDLHDRWRHNWQDCPPIAHDLKHSHPDRWVRFHSLPESKRYPGDEAEYATVLHRYNTVLDELFAGEDVLVITPDWSDDATPEPRPADHERWHPGAEYWTHVSPEHPDFVSYVHLYVSQLPWRRGALDELLHAVADDETAGVMITSLSMDRIHHPYDGGADVLLPTTAARDALKARHPDWLSTHPGGL
ncbi:DUF3885 domain-containing protein [Amycolatopsis suaedae]|uniref:DUF3885 domain-containing protein n=1 Tax=Amycolatopsis suaedae TaxID=2510978 RepID=A0A4Q7J7F3_9PSEU|nr:hypothetical protein [Amycolatopsis suaedae]RZQ62722.1 hypothetical protein EWH70_17330 [Amycolatopsis suaedae]